MEKTRRFVVGLCIVIGLIAAAVQFFLPHFFPAVAASMAMPFWRVEFASGGDSLRAPDAVLQENEELRLMLAEADLRLDTISAVEEENARLKAMLGRGTGGAAAMAVGASGAGAGAGVGDSGAAETASGTPAEAETISNFETDPSEGRMLAAVLMHPPLSIYDHLIIDIGTNDGVSVNDKVYSPSGVLIGRISEALGKTSKVRLYSSSGESHSVLIGQSDVAATALGRGGGQYEARLPQGATIEEGDFVVSPSLNDKPFAVVTTVLKDPAQPFETVLFAPPVNVYQLRWVTVEVE